jgi:hypothetical protein
MNFPLIKLPFFNSKESAHAIDAVRHRATTHFLFITYVRLLQKFEILAGKLTMHIYPRRFPSESTNPEQSRSGRSGTIRRYRKEKSFSTREAQVRSSRLEFVFDHLYA